MKIIAISGINGDIEAFAKLQDKITGMYISGNGIVKSGGIHVVCAGNLLGKCLEDTEIQQINAAYDHLIRRIENFERNPSGIIKAVIKDHEDADLEEAVGKNSPPEDVFHAAEIYDRIEKHFLHRSKEQYVEMRKLIGWGYPSTHVVPGSTDSRNVFDDVWYVHLHPRPNNVKCESLGWQGLAIAGVGGSRHTNRSVPPTQRIPFLRGAYDFLDDFDSDVAVVSENPLIEGEDYISSRGPTLIVHGGNDWYSCREIKNQSTKGDPVTVSLCPGSLNQGIYAEIDGRVVDDYLKINDIKKCKL
jgi:hypothetical protein